MSITVQHLYRSDVDIRSPKGAPACRKSVPDPDIADILLFSFQGVSSVFENGRLDEDESHNGSDFGSRYFDLQGLKRRGSKSDSGKAQE